MAKIMAKKLQKQWNISAKHVLYSEDGSWYHKLKHFPGALFDAGGFIIFNTVEEYESCLYLNISPDADQLHVPERISAIPGYTFFTELDKKINEISITIQYSDQAQNDLAELNQPQRIPQVINRIIRDTVLSQQIKALYNYKCQLCGETINLGEKLFYAEAHHIKPLGNPHNGPDTLGNILCVCPNHHVQLDFKAIQLNIKNLSLHPNHNLKDEYIHYHNKLVGQ